MYMYIHICIHVYMYAAHDLQYSILTCIHTQGIHMYIYIGI